MALHSENSSTPPGLPLADAEIAAVLVAMKAQAALFRVANFALRAEALDELEVHVLDRLDGLLAAAPSAARHRLRRRAGALQTRLHGLNQQLFEQLRQHIRAGQLSPTSLRARLAACVGPGSWPAGSSGIATDYDSLDVLTEGLAQPLAAEAREPEMVQYQKTPARIIGALAAKLSAQDVFYDLGSGLGQVALLVRLLSGATATGVEIEAAYCRHAQACADDLRLTRVHFLHADARRVDYADGTAFFLFTPFRGHILQQVLDRLRLVAQRRPLRLFSYGPGTLALAPQPWLRRLDPPDSHLYQLAEFESR